MVPDEGRVNFGRVLGGPSSWCNTWSFCATRRAKVPTICGVSPDAWCKTERIYAAG
jgi:hypothetical protein